MFQTSLAITILSVAYGVHAREMPFVSSAEQHALVLAQSMAAQPTAAAMRVQVHSRKRASIVALAAAAGGTLMHITEFNVLESALLITCFFVLLVGAIFKSAVFEPGSAVERTFTFVIFAILMTTLLVFSWTVVSEFRRELAALAIREKESRTQRESAASVELRTAFKLRNRVSLSVSRARRSLFSAASGSIGSMEWRSSTGDVRPTVASDTLVPIHGPDAAGSTGSEADAVITRNPMPARGGGGIRARVASMDIRMLRSGSGPATK